MKNLILEEIRRLKDNKTRTQPQQNGASQPAKAEKLFPLSNSNTSSLKSSTQIFERGLDLFKGMSFCFPMIDIDLSPKRIECMSKSIRQQGGVVHHFKDQIISTPIDYLLVNPKASVQMLLRKIDNKIVFKEILDYNYVNHCMRQAILLAISKYSLYKNRQSLIDCKQEENTMTIQAKPQKMVKTETEPIRHRVSLDSDIDTEAIDDNEQTQTMLAPAKTLNTLFTQPEENSERSLSQQSKKRQKKALNKQVFLCQKAKPLDGQQSFSINKFICDELMKLQRIYEGEKDVGRKIAYLKAVSAIKTLDKEIESQKDLQNLRGVGSKIIKKVKQLLHNGKLEKLQSLQRNEKRVIIQEFCGVWGIGPNKAEELYSQGIRTVQELRKRTDLLNKNQRIGLKYLQDFKQKIPREKVTKIVEVVQRIFSALVDNRQGYHLQLCGSYRRGRSHCGDIDILISRKDGKYQRKLLLSLILQLQKEGLLTDHLVFPNASTQKSSLSYMGVCQYEEPIHHRIDIKYYHINQYPYALLYFTGSDMFNRSMRLYASKIGIQLNDHGAVARRKHASDDVWDKPIPVCREEREIFQFLGLDYKTPQERDV